MISVWRTCW